MQRSIDPPPGAEYPALAPRTILHIITLPDLGGAQSHVLDLLRGFQGRARLHLATSRPGPLTVAAQALGVPVHLLPSLQRSIAPTADGRAVPDCIALIRRVPPRG